MSSRGDTTPAALDVERVFRREHGRVVAQLARRLGDLDLAEDAAAEALVVALERWPTDGLPPNPGAWLTTTAQRRAIDRIRRERQRDDKHRAAQMILDDTPHEATGVVEDDRLRLVFTCCHPALAPEARVALTLRLLGGLTVPEIAAAFLVPETTMAQRITRAKAKIKGAHIPYRVPAAADLPARLEAVLAVLYLVFNEGYLATGSGEPLRAELTQEALRLTRVLHELLPEEPEVQGLLALQLLVEARRPARLDDADDAALVPLDRQDRSRWDAALVAEGHALVRGCLARVAAGGAPPGRFQVLAAVQAVHTDAPTFAATDWRQVLALYDQLLALDPSPVARLNRAVALAELDGPQVGLAEVDRLAERLARYPAWHSTRAALLRRLGRDEEARAGDQAALALTANTAERAFLEQRLAHVTDPPD
ncbi:RNA polymerase sigma factor [Nocardioides nanhaiensis]|uniref:Sigma factor-like helix-turn-helix DNA-binding protein n=1 Tax=Nocardioides nanhaiensis TaxID=1476871 RepID=A0ABP8VNX1_9ACTN